MKGSTNHRVVEEVRRPAPIVCPVGWNAPGDCPNHGPDGYGAFYYGTELGQIGIRRTACHIFVYSTSYMLQQICGDSWVSPGCFVQIRRVKASRRAEFTGKYNQ
jgi:hypothetical protein